MKYKMATYPGMSLGGEVRESVSLDEDDLSDVEDEVFIRDGKNGYKFAEDIGVKRPLMAPRRKVVKPDFRSRLKYRPPWCRWCKPLCFVLAILVIITGVLVLGIILVSMFPLPIDKIKNWITTKTQKNVTVKLLPCSDLKVTDLWSTSLPKLTSETSIRSVDIDIDGVMDVIFGFGTGDVSALDPDIFCPMFMGVASPCGGGLIALNGTNGDVIWKKHLPHTILTLFCSSDFNGDLVFDCIAGGYGGILVAVNAKTGDILWEFNDKSKDNQKILDIYTPNFVPDQNNDGVEDIIAVHTIEEGQVRKGHIFLISGKNGEQIRSISTPNSIETYYIPQLLPLKNGQYKVLIGTGGPTSAGNLTIFDLKELAVGNDTVNFETLYQDTFKGILSPSILVDITGDEQVDIVTAMFNSTVVAIDGATFKQIWNITVNNSETFSIPTPGYFNGDNVTDFLIKYETGPEFPVYYYSQVYIIDGKTGKFIYDSPVVDSVGSQMGGLTLSMEGFGFDFFTYWLADCKYYEGRRDAYEFLSGSDFKDQSNSDLCKLRFNSTKIIKLFALNQFDQPPGLEIYSSENRTNIEYNNTKTPIEEASEYVKKHPEVQVGGSEQQSPSSEVVEVYKQAPELIKNNRYKDGSPFRHKDNNQGLIKDYGKIDKNKLANSYNKDDFDTPDYDQQSNWKHKTSYTNYFPGDIDENYETDPISMYNPNNQLMVNDEIANNNRDTRGGTDPEPTPKSLKKNLSDDKYNIYNYNNVREAKNRILNDLHSVPTEILKDTFIKNRARELRKSRLEQRDLNSHVDKLQENKEMEHVLMDEMKKLVNVSENLWDLESEKELEDRKNGYWRGKRESRNINIKGIPKITSLGTLVKAVGVEDKNAVDLIFLTYWLPPKEGPQILIDKDYECIAAKIKNVQNSQVDLLQTEKMSVEEFYKKVCVAERAPPVKNTVENSNSNFPYSNQMHLLRLGQMTVYKIRLECVCNSNEPSEKCAKFLEPGDTKGWSEYLGRAGDGIFGRP